MLEISMLDMIFQITMTAAFLRGQWVKVTSYYLKQSPRREGDLTHRSESIVSIIGIFSQSLAAKCQKILQDLWGSPGKFDLQTIISDNW